ncbi:MAG TPA: DUF5679 domain-containing protein [Patescibacteria group bacterium]|nr:DUF5679 domain-containing protein [Patescibacteria group bacterium]
MTNIYCVHCKKKVYIISVKQIKTKNHRTAITGLCSVCGTRCYQLL